MTATINALPVSGFRSCGPTPQSLLCSTALKIVSATNSQGKTSLAEAFEFLLTGKIVRRELTASAQEEFADALRNAHLDASHPVYVIAEVTDGCGFRRIRPGIPGDVGHLIPIEAGRGFRLMSAGVACARWSGVVCHRLG